MIIKSSPLSKPPSKRILLEVTLSSSREQLGFEDIGTVRVEHFVNLWSEGGQAIDSL